MMKTLPNFLGEEFNNFLFAPIGTDQHGGQLSVVSALARLDLDAWAEADTLSRLPQSAAVAKLSGILVHYPEIPQLRQDTATVATRLLALLPRRAAPLQLMPSAGSPAPVNWVAVTTAGGLSVLAVIGLLIGQQYATQVSAQHNGPPTALTQQMPPNPP